MSEPVPLAEAFDAATVGGKAASLGRLVRAGLPVPDGFVVPNDCHCDERILTAYAALGGGTVAVRSSAAAEDGGVSSMAGQFETVLNVRGDAALLDAVRHCRASADAPRVLAYAAERGIAPDGLRVSVVVQRQVDADAAGVLFTASPDDSYPRQMRVEAAWGLGETVVSGRVQPDVYRLGFADGRIVSSVVGRKSVELKQDGERDVPPDRQHAACLTDEIVHALWQLGRRLEAHFAVPQDVEWAVAGGQLYVLQSRTITTHADAHDAEAAVTDARERVRELASRGQGPWVVHNLAETLPAPTPLSWGVWRRFMSAEGGYGRAYRVAGFDPQGEFLELIGGRAYMDASRAPRMFAADFPYAYDAAELRDRPDASQRPPTRPVGSPLARWRAGRRLRRVERTLDTLRPNAAAGRAMLDFIDAQERTDQTSASAEELAEHWWACERRVMDECGRNEVVSGLRAARALKRLAETLAEVVWDEDSHRLAAELASGGTADVNQARDDALRRVGTGELSLHTWIDAHGHRGINELELSAPRWRERPDDARTAAARLASAASPGERHRTHAQAVERKLAAISSKSSAADARVLAARVAAAAAAVRDREAAKDTLVRGVGLLRSLAVEIGRRLGTGDDVFFLTPDEMLAALAGEGVPRDEIDTRRRRHAASARLRWPRFIDGADAIGASAAPATGCGLAVSAGTACGPARVMRTPSDGTLRPGEVLVCPSTDPAWTPVMAGAAAVVVEIGGTLSHGAVVARELGLPAVVLADATRRFTTGDVLHIDGTSGSVDRVAVDGDVSILNSVNATTPPDAADVRPDRVPPPAGSKDRRAARLRNACAAAWALFLLAFFLLSDAAVRRPTFAAFDAVGWPLSRAFGWPVVVAAAAAATAAVTLGLQRVLTDNARLREARRRAENLRREATRWPAGSTARTQRTAMAAGVTGRGLGASLVPVGVLLGPMVAGFVWLGERAAPAGRNAPAGHPVVVTATLHGDYVGPVTLAPPPDAAVDPSTPPTQRTRPIRTTLQTLLDGNTLPPADAADLRAYLARGVPPQRVAWTVRPPDGFDGRVPVAVAADGGPPVSVTATVGPSRPRVAESATAGGTGLVGVRVDYPAAPPAPSFLELFGVDVGWLGVYVAAYVVALVAVRKAAGVA